MEELATERAPVGKLIPHQLMWKIPSHQQTCEEPAYRQEHLTSDKVEDVEQCLAQKTHYLISSKRQRTECSKYTTRNRNNQCSLLATDMQLLMEKSRTHLMQ